MQASGLWPDADESEAEVEISSDAATASPQAESRFMDAFDAPTPR